MFRSLLLYICHLKLTTNPLITYSVQEKNVGSQCKVLLFESNLLPVSLLCLSLSDMCFMCNKMVLLYNRGGKASITFSVYIGTVTCCQVLKNVFTRMCNIAKPAWPDDLALASVRDTYSNCTMTHRGEIFCRERGEVLKNLTVKQ